MLPEVPVDMKLTPVQEFAFGLFHARLVDRPAITEVDEAEKLTIGATASLGTISTCGSIEKVLGVVSIWKNVFGESTLYIDHTLPSCPGGTVTTINRPLLRVLIVAK